MSARLDSQYRARAVNSFGDTEIDVLVIGGGVVGAGAALDAASRGLTGILVRPGPSRQACRAAPAS